MGVTRYIYSLKRVRCVTRSQMPKVDLCMVACWRLNYRSGTVDSKSFIGNILLRIKWNSNSQCIQLRIEGHFGFPTFWTKFCNILKYGMNLKFETIVQLFRKIMQLNAVIILKSINEHYRKIISKSGLKMDLYPAMVSMKCTSNLANNSTEIFEYYY